MSTIKHQEILAFAKDRIKASTNLKTVMSVALGIALSRMASLPSSELVNDDSYSYYSSKTNYVVLDSAAMFNENILVDLDLVSETARSFWLLRYFNAFPLKVIPLMGNDDSHFMNKLTGVGHSINPEVFQMCQEDATTIISIVNKIRELEV